MCISLDHTVGGDPVGAQRRYEELWSPIGCLQNPEMHIPPWYWFRFEWTRHSETLSPYEARTQFLASLKEEAPPCQRCWDLDQREEEINLLVESITTRDLSELATIDITGENGEFQAAVTSVCIESGCPVEVPKIKEIVQKAIEIRQGQLDSSDPNHRSGWCPDVREQFIVRLGEYAKVQAQ